MKIGQKVYIYDDGKSSRKVEGVVTNVIDTHHIVVQHILWGYGDESCQIPLDHLYTKVDNVWKGCQTSYFDKKENCIVIFEHGCEFAICVKKEK